VILTSPKLRALQTAEIVASPLEREAVVDDRLGGSLGIGVVERILRDAGQPRRPVLVGHDPDFSELLAELTGVPRLEMKKGALARVDLPSGVQSGSGVLRWLLPPDLLPPHG
jgi:phosphohistidine phosphatase